MMLVSEFKNICKLPHTWGNFIKKEALAQVFSCEFCKISKNTFFTEYLWTTASVSIEKDKQHMKTKWD